jgi:hypothetical protein
MISPAQRELFAHQRFQANVLKLYLSLIMLQSDEKEKGSAACGEAQGG